MRLYHMSQSLTVGDIPIPDAQECAGLAEPFVQAMEYGTGCFLAMVLNAKYTYAVLNKYGMREWSNYAKWATEGVFEYIRRKEYPNALSRMNCVFYYADTSYSRKLYNEDFSEESDGDRENLRLYEVEVGDARPDRRDMSLFDDAFDALSERQDAKEAAALARRYFAGERSDHPVWEYLSDKYAEVVRDVTFVLRDN